MCLATQMDSLANVLVGNAVVNSSRQLPPCIRKCCASFQEGLPAEGSLVTWVWCFLMSPGAERKMSRFLSNFWGFRQSLNRIWKQSMALGSRESPSARQVSELPVLARELQPWLGSFLALVHKSGASQSPASPTGAAQGSAPQSSLLPSLPLLPTTVGTMWIWGLWNSDADLPP